MTDYERQLFNGICPYTDKPCDTDIDCGKCEVNEEERHMFEEQQGENIDD